MAYCIALSVILADRLIKFLVMVNLRPGEPVVIFPFLNLTYLKNTGIAFSLFHGANNILVWINAAVILFLMGILYSSKDETRSLRAAYALIMGGALSNLWDRIAYGAVIDFIDFKIWPVFNIADTAITAGAALIAYNLISACREKKKN
ncbi:MAG: signal peptidase II [Elusimicrobiota bacterium]|nr:signal peptidase II [Elusimicrobiota bacterium]